MPADDIDVDAELSEFGFDSITLTMFGNILNERYGLTLAPTVFFEHPTLNGFAEHLLGEYWGGTCQALQRFRAGAASGVASPYCLHPRHLRPLAGSALGSSPHSRH